MGNVIDKAINQLLFGVVEIKSGMLMGFYIEIMISLHLFVEMALYFGTKMDTHIKIMIVRLIYTKMHLAGKNGVKMVKGIEKMIYPP